MHSNKKAYRWDLEKIEGKTAIKFGLGEIAYRHKQGRAIANKVGERECSSIH